MKTLDSSSLVESSMEEDTSRHQPHHVHLQTLTEPNNLNKNTITTTTRRFMEENDKEDDDGGEECDVEVWETLSKNFRQVQSVLDQNRLLIQLVNQNHQSKIPDNLVRNVALIREINSNISKVTSIYSDLSVNFCNILHQRRSIMGSKNSSNICSIDNKVESTES